MPTSTTTDGDANRGSPTAAEAAPASPTGRRATARGARAGFVLLAVLALGGYLLPGLTTMWRSLRPDDGSGLGPANLTWVVDSESRTVLVSLLWAIGLAMGGVALGVLLGGLLLRTRRPRLWASCALVPAALGGVVVAVVWRATFAFRPSGRGQVGLVNEVVTTVGASPVAWLSQEPLVNTVVLVAAGIWVFAGVVAWVVVHAVDARLGGRSPWDTSMPAGAPRFAVVRGVVWPVVRRPASSLALLGAVVGIRVHDPVQVATGGAFGTDVLSTASLSRTFELSQTGRGAALAAVATALVMPPALLLGHRLWHGTLLESRGGPSQLRPVGRGRHSASAADDSTPEQRHPRWWRALGAAVGLVWLLPVIGVLIDALRPASDVAAGGWWRWPLDPAATLDSLRRVAGDGTTGGMAGALVDSALVVAPVVAVVVGAALAISAALSTLPSRTGRLALLGLVVAAALPVSVVLPPLHRAADAAGVLGELPTVWVVQAVIWTPLAALGFWAARHRSERSPRPVPVDGERPAPARDGAVRMEVPAAAVAAVAVIVGLLVWDDLVVAATFLGAGDAVPAPLRLTELVAARGEELHLVAAGAVLAASVPVVVVLSLQSVLARVWTPRDPRLQDEEVPQRGDGTNS